MSRPRSGIVGGGFMGQVHAHAVRAAGGVVSRVAGRTAEAAVDFRDRVQAENAAASVEELVAADDVDVVHVCTPNMLHAEQAALALDAGKAVICEKPLATSPKDAQVLAESAHRSGLVTSVPFVYRYYLAVREARVRIARGDAGTLWLLHGSYLQDWLSGSGDTNWRVDPVLGGVSRAFADVGVHWCDLMEFVTGQRITRLSARMAHAFPSRRMDDGRSEESTEDGALVLFETDQGASGSVTVSQVSPGRKNRLWFSFDGPDAGYVFDHEQPDALWVGGRLDSRIVPSGPDTLSPGAREGARLPAGHPQGYQDCFNAFVGDVYAAVRGEPTEGRPTFDDGLRAATITAAVVESAMNETWEEITA